MAASKFLKGLKKVAKRVVKNKKSTTADKAVSKSIGKDAADINQPADISSVGKEDKGNNPGALTDSQLRMGKTSRATRAYKAAEKEKTELQTKLESLTKKSQLASVKIKGPARIKEIEKLKEQKDSIKEAIKLLETRMDGPKGLKARYPIKKCQKKPVKAKKTRVAKSGGAIGCGKALRGQGKGPYKKKGM